jgi:hypothetical protein
LILGAEIDHGGDLADEFDLEARLDGVQDDMVDEPAQDLERLDVRVGSASAVSRSATLRR